MTSLTFNPDDAVALTAPAAALAFLKNARNEIAEECEIDIRDTRHIKAWIELAQCAATVWKERAEASAHCKTYFANLDAILLGNTEALLAFKKLIAKMAEEDYAQLEQAVKAAELRLRLQRAMRLAAHEADLDDLKLATQKTEERGRTRAAERAVLAADRASAREEEVHVETHAKRLRELAGVPEPAAVKEESVAERVVNLQQEAKRRLRHDCERIVTDVATGTVLCDEKNRWHPIAALLYTLALRRGTPDHAFATALDQLVRRRAGHPQLTIAEARSFLNQYNKMLEQADADEGFAQARDLFEQLGVAEDRYATP